MRDVPDDGSRRPLTARSVIASTLLGVDPPRLPALALVRSGELFGLREGATRTALSRMAAAGEVVGDDGHYSLAGRLLVRHGRQQQARRPDRSADRDWDGTWVLAMVTADRRSARQRAAFRDAARELKMAEVREGVWARPGDLGSPSSDAAATVTAQATWVHGARPEDPDRFAAAFEPTQWSRTARDLLDEVGAAHHDLEARSVEAIAPAFVTSAAVLRHLLADPDLPTSLLPDDWPGAELRSAYAGFDATFKATWRQWYETFRDT